MMIILMVVRDTCIINMIITRYFFQGVWATQGYRQGDENLIWFLLFFFFSKNSAFNYASCLSHWDKEGSLLVTGMNKRS